MASAPQDSILPPALRIRPAARAAVIATLMTAALAVFADWFSLWLVPDGGTVAQVLVLLVAWPAFGVVAGLAAGMFPGYLFYPLLLVAEWLYVWVVLLLIMKALARRRAGSVSTPAAGS